MSADLDDEHPICVTRTTPSPMRLKRRAFKKINLITRRNYVAQSLLMPVMCVCTSVLAAVLLCKAVFQLSCAKPYSWCLPSSCQAGEAITKGRTGLTPMLADFGGSTIDVKRLHQPKRTCGSRLKGCGCLLTWIPLWTTWKALASSVLHSCVLKGYSWSHSHE